MQAVEKNLDTVSAKTQLHRRRMLWLVIAFAAAGIICRLAQFLARTSFWEDEIAVLVNLQRHTMRELPFVKLVDYDPSSPVAAPAFFLWTTKWLGEHFHYSEWSVRLLPLICSIAAVIVFAHLAWRLVSPVAAAWAVALLALSDPLIFQAGNVKPYSGDVLVAALIVWAAFVARPNAPPARRLLAAAIVTAIGIWLSYPAVFVFAAVTLAMWPDFLSKGARGFVQMALSALPVLASFLAVYFLSIRAQRSPTLDVYWVHLFADWSRPLSIPVWLVGGTWEMFHFQMYPLGPIMIAAVAIGIWALSRRSPRLLILLLGLWALDLIAACVSQYPYGGTRLTLFLLPFLALLAGEGAAAVPALWPKQKRWAQAALAIVPLAMAGLAAYQLLVPRSKGDLRDAVRFLNSHRKPDEEVYLVGQQTLGAASWYLPNRDPLIHEHLAQSAPIHDQRYWVVLSYEPRKYKENKPAMTQPGCKVDESRSFHTAGADVLWFVPAGEAK